MNQTLKLGVLVILGTAIFVTVIYLIGSQQNLFSKNITINAKFSNISGLLAGNNVRYAGVDVGKVKTITLLNDSVINVAMTVSEKMAVHIKKNAVATVASDGLVGNMVVNIMPGKGEASKIENGDTIESAAQSSTEEILNTLNSAADNAAYLIVQLHDILRSVKQGQGTLGMLINDSIAAQDMKLTFSNLNQSSLKAHQTIDEINSLVKSVDLNKGVAGVILNDSLQANKLKNVISNLEQSTQDLKRMSYNLNQALDDIKEGEGAINYLAKDKEFVENLDKTIKNLNEGTDKFNQNMEALKHNFLTRGYFRKLEKEQKKAAKKEQKNK